MIFKGLGIQWNDQGLAPILSKRFPLVEGNVGLWGNSGKRYGGEGTGLDDQGWLDPSPGS